MQKILVEKSGPVTTLIINRPEVRNRGADSTAQRRATTSTPAPNGRDACSISGTPATERFLLSTANQ